MDITTMMAMGLFDSDEDEEEGGGNKLTDLQFKALMKLYLALAESTREIKDFRRNGGFGADCPYGSILTKIVDITGDLERARTVLNDILRTFP